MMNREQTRSLEVTMRKNSLSERKMLLPAASERKMLSPAAVEALYGIPRGSLANLRWSRRGPPFYKVGLRRVLYRAEDVVAWVESHPVLTKE